MSAQDATVDHLVVAAASLDEGARWCEATFGIKPGPGGRHALMGTHNRLFSIASVAFPETYFEIIAIDPEAPPPGRVRWFGLDAIDLSSGPRLIHWVGRVADIDARLESLSTAGVDAGRAIEASRDTPSGRLAWRIAVRDDGALLRGGALPTLIEWGARHPSTSMPRSGVTLRRLTLRGLDHAITRALSFRGAQIAADAGPAISAVLDTPRGEVSLNTME